MWVQWSKYIRANKVFVWKPRSTVTFFTDGDPTQKVRISDLQELKITNGNKNLLTFRYHGVVDRNPYKGLISSLYTWVVFHPLYTLNNHVFFHCSPGDVFLFVTPPKKKLTNECDDRWILF